MAYLVQDCSNSSALAVELLQSCTKPSMLYSIIIYQVYSTDDRAPFLPINMD